jgi:glycosyltransferase involved in cell wall biosynthesis
MKRISINGRFLCRRATGVDRFAFELLSVIDRWVGERSPLVDGLCFRVVVPKAAGTVPAICHIPVIHVGGRSGQSWEQWDLPKAMGPNEWLLSLCNTAPILGRRQIVAIHDAATVAVPQAFSRVFRTWYRFLMPALGRRARSIVTVSEFSRLELQQAFGVAATKISVVSEGGEHILRHQPDIDALVRHGLHERPYVLAVSSMAAHKNFQLVLAALAKIPNPPFDVAIAGGANSAVFGQAGAALGKQVKWLGYVSDAELRALYEGATAFVFPSIYEGFGIPPLEAMHCGCPVLAARAASIPEVCGDAAIYFDPRSSDELASVLLQVTGDRALREKLRAKGYAQAARFGWDLGAQQLLDVCRSAVGTQR